MGLAAVVHTESGRTERFRHYMRKRFTLSEPQLAVLTELLLRGRQSIGDLRARASRMVPIESLDDLRVALKGLLEQKYVQANAALERRGVEVDHNFYAASENKKLTWDSRVDADDDGGGMVARPHSATSTHATPEHRPHAVDLQASAAALRSLHEESAELRGRIDSLEHELSRLKGVVDDLVRDLRG
jgi:uncharacterized protein YceH (UPF0502 family)